MKKIAIIGGKLQGLEACYLGKKAEMHLILIDKNSEAIARNLCDEFFCIDVLAEEDKTVEILKKVDVVIPTLENFPALQRLVYICKKERINLAFDYESYLLTKSKVASDRVFEKLKLNPPKYFPLGKSPYIGKPIDESGSREIKLIKSKEDALNYIKTRGNKFLVQEFIEGPSYSIEVVGKPGNYRTYEITQIHMDDKFDCKMVNIPARLSKIKEMKLAKMALEIAQTINLHGIMDLEVIYDGYDFRPIEIDARFPTQSPIVVYHSTGENLIDEIYDICAFGDFQKNLPFEKKFASYENYLIKNDQILWEGEKVISEGKPQKLYKGILNSDETLSDYESKTKEFRVIFINWDKSYEELEAKRKRVLNALENTMSNKRMDNR